MPWFARFLELPMSRTLSLWAVAWRSRARPLRESLKFSAPVRRPLTVPRAIPTLIRLAAFDERASLTPSENRHWSVARLAQETRVEPKPVRRLMATVDDRNLNDARPPTFVKVALTLLATSIDTAQMTARPLHPPPHAVNFELASVGAAVRVTVAG